MIKLLAHWDEDSSTFYLRRSNGNEVGYDDLEIEYISVYQLDKIQTE